MCSMCGGDSEHFAEVEKIMQSYSKSILLMGPAGSGHHTKMVNQIAVASTMVGVTEGLFYAFTSGLDTHKVLQVISGGGAASFCLTSQIPRVLKGDFEPGVAVEHFVKDVGIAQQECTKMDSMLPGLELASKLYNQLSAELGHSKSGAQSLIKVYEHLNQKSFTTEVTKQS